MARAPLLQRGGRKFESYRDDQNKRNNMTGSYFKNKDEVVDKDGKTIWKRYSNGTEVAVDKDGNEIITKVGTKGATFQQVGGILRSQI